MSEQSLNDMIRDIHKAQIDAAGSLGRIEQSISTITADAAVVKELVDKHERIYIAGKITALPVLFGFHILVKWFVSKLGWN